MKYGSAKRQVRLRRKLSNRNPVFWLACRERWQSLGLWIIGLLLAAVLLAFACGKLPRQEVFISSTLGWIYMMVLYLGAASRTGRFFVEARQSGLTELCDTVIGDYRSELARVIRTVYLSTPALMASLPVTMKPCRR